MIESGFIIFTTETGGLYKAIDGTREEYETAVETGSLVIRHEEIDEWATETFDLKFVAFGSLEANHDFVLGRAR